MIANHQILFFLILICVASTTLAVYYSRSFTDSENKNKENKTASTVQEKFEISQPQLTLGVFSGFRFGLGFGLGVSVALLSIGLFFGGVFASVFRNYWFN